MYRKFPENETEAPARAEAPFVGVAEELRPRRPCRCAAREPKLLRGDLVGDEAGRGLARDRVGLDGVVARVHRAGDEHEVLPVVARGDVVTVELLHGDHLERLLVEEEDLRLGVAVGLLDVGPDLGLLAGDGDLGRAGHLDAEADGLDLRGAIVDRLRVVAEVGEELLRGEEDRVPVRVDERHDAIDGVALELRAHLEGRLVAVLVGVDEDDRRVLVELGVAEGRELHVAGVGVVALEADRDVRELVVVDLAEVAGGGLHGDEHGGLVRLGEDGDVEELGEAVALGPVHLVQLVPDLPVRVAPDGVTGEMLGEAVLGDEGFAIGAETLVEEREDGQHGLVTLWLDHKPASWPAPSTNPEWAVNSGA